MNIINKIAEFITDDPDIFNEMAMSTGAIGIGVPEVLPKSKKKIKTNKKYYADPVTGQPRAKGVKGKEGEVLYSDTQSEEPEKPLKEHQKT